MSKFYSYAKNLLVPAMVLAGAIVSYAAPARPADEPLFRFAQKAKYSGLSSNFRANDAKRAASVDAELQLVGDRPTVGYLDGPDGSEWLFTVEYTKEYVDLPGGVAKDVIITRYTYTIYDSNLKKVGTVSDAVTLAEDETRLSQVMLDPTVTKKFFNNDENYELIVSAAYNTANYTNNYRTKVYSIGAPVDDNGNTPVLMEFDGYVVSTVNAAPDVWSENFYITFLTEKSGNIDDYDNYVDYLNSYYEILTTYKKAGWNPAPSVVDVVEVQSSSLPGDQDTAPFFMSLKHDDKAVFAVSHYEKPFFIDPIGENENQTPDNSLVITLYEVGSTGFNEIQKTKIPVEQSTAQGDLYTYYSIGNLGYTEDIDFGHYLSDASKASFVVTRGIYQTESDEKNALSFYLYDGDGNKVRAISENTETAVRMSDLPGYEPQYLFIEYNDEADVRFKFMDMYSGIVVADLPAVLEDAALTTSIDRCLSGNSYKWVVWLGIPELDESTGHTIEFVAWIDSEGQFIDHIDRIDLGADVPMSLFNISQPVLSPYLFNTDAKQEYMMLVKRYINEVSSETQEEFQICDSEGNILFQAMPDDVKGRIAGVSVLNIGHNPQLIVSYCDDNYIFTQDIYSLPLVKFGLGGNGTAQNPYKIATIGDLHQIKDDMKANYVVVNDIDAGDYVFKPIVDNNFTGVLDGAGHSIDNLIIEGDGINANLFGNLGEGAVVKNLIFNDAKILFSANEQYAGLVAGQAIEAELNNIHVDGITIESQQSSAMVGGIVSMVALHTSVISSSVKNATFDIPNATVGGLVGEAFTGSMIKVCAFEGSINGSIAGGLVGTVNSADSEITDCRANADIVAKGAVGGVAATSDRAKMMRCIVEGSLEATGDRWGESAVGGIVGELQTDFALSGVSGNVVPVISNCLVNVESIKGVTPAATPSYANEFTTIHRIVGRSSANEEPEAGKKTYPAEPALADNYAVETLALGQSDIEAESNTVEGASIAADNLDRAFFESLGFKYGKDVENPWSEKSIAVPELFFEDEVMSGVCDDLTDDNSSIIYDGTEVCAEGNAIAIYNMSGVLVASGNNALDVTRLANGVYVAVTVNADGNTEVLKIVVK